MLMTVRCRLEPSRAVRIPSRALQLQHGYDIQHTDWYLTLRSVSGFSPDSVHADSTGSMVCGPSRQLWTVPDSSGRYPDGSGQYPDGIWISGYGIWMVSGWLWTVGLSGRLWMVSGQYPDGIWISGYGIWMVSGWLWTVGLSGWLWTVSGRYPDSIQTVSG